MSRLRKRPSISSRARTGRARMDERFLEGESNGAGKRRKGLLCGPGSAIDKKGSRSPSPTTWGLFPHLERSIVQGPRKASTSFILGF